MTQLAIPFAKTPEDRFQAFHRANPWVLAELLRLALEMRRHQSHWGIAAAFEVLRWERRATVGDEFKLNNDYRARYARLLNQDPRLRGFFRTRKSAADGEGK